MPLSDPWAVEVGGVFYFEDMGCAAGFDHEAATAQAGPSSIARRSGSVSCSPFGRGLS
jgi:hypothetical protein